MDGDQPAGFREAKLTRPRRPAASAGLPLSAAERVRLAAAAQTVRACRQELARRGTSLIDAVIGAAPLVVWRHYPEAEVYDTASHAQYFYHRHPAGTRPADEHGHFHAFLRAEGMPQGVAPLVLPEIAVAAAPALAGHGAPLKRGVRDEISHLVAIALDPRGEPIRLFTTNRWVTGETWYRAEDVIAMLDQFTVGIDEPSTALNGWIGAMIALFRPQIAELLRARDEQVMSWRRRRRTLVFEDPRLEVTSSLDINVDSQLAQVDALADAGPATIPALPPMAEGWGEHHPG